MFFFLFVCFFFKAAKLTQWCITRLHQTKLHCAVGGEKMNDMIHDEHISLYVSTVLMQQLTETVETILC